MVGALRNTTGTLVKPFLAKNVIVNWQNLIIFEQN